MKLNPPASSSDLDAALEIARRLHRRRRREDRSLTEERDTVPQLVSTLVPPHPGPPPPRPAAPPPPPPEPPAAEPLEPSLDEPGGPDAPALDALDAFADIGEPARPAESASAGIVEGLDADEPPVSPEEMVGVPEPPPLDDLPGNGPPLDSPFDVDLDEPPVEDMVEIARVMARVATLPLAFQPNAGLPETRGGELVYHQSPEQMAARVPELLALGVAIVGGCCGTTPEHVRALRQAADAWTAADPGGLR